MKIKIKEKTKAWGIMTWFVLSLVAVLITSQEISIYLALSLVSLLLSARMTIVHADLIDRYIKMID